MNGVCACKSKTMYFKFAYLLLSVLLASLLATAQLPYYSPFPNTGLRIYNAFARGLFSVVNAVENAISSDLLQVESKQRQLNHAVGITGNIPRLLAYVARSKDNFLQRTYTRIRSAVTLALLKLRESVMYIQSQYVRTPHIERILSELVKLGYNSVGRILRIALNIASRMSETVYKASEIVKKLHEEALQSGPGYRNLFEQLFERNFDQAVPIVRRNVYGGLGRINRVIDNAVDESRHLARQL